MIAALALAGSLSLFALNAVLAPSSWSLADALSEEVELPVMIPGPGGIATPQLGPDGQPLMVARLVASSSRLIALMGLFGILLLYLGFGVFVLYYFGTGQPLPSDLDKVRDFLMAGLVMFAPYLINKFASVFQGLTPRR